MYSKQVVAIWTPFRFIVEIHGYSMFFLAFIANAFSVTEEN